ncbi:MAG: UDP-glucose 4-epimerase GalE [Chlamydiota bacterium]|jgi:UDP-glucose-4-epimerase GalE
MNKAILVTGGAGYIGSHTAKALAEHGFLPIVYDNLSTGHPWAVQWGPLVQGDIRNTQDVVKAIQKYRCEAVIHFAAVALVGESVQDPAKYYDNNVVGTVSLLDAMRQSGLSRIIVSSSCATYGEPVQTPMSEDHPQKPVSPYGRSKLMMEEILRDYDAAYGIKHVVLRYFNVAGADLDGKVGEAHDPETHLVPSAVLAALGAAKELAVFGLDFPTPDGTALRDYTHVVDIADAHVKALMWLDSESASFNLGSGTSFSVLDVIRAVEHRSRKELPYQIKPRRVGDPTALTAAIDKAKKHLGWTPRHSDLMTMIETAWQWHSR